MAMTKAKLKQVEEQYQREKQPYDDFKKALVLEKAWLETELNIVNKTIEALK